jgi:hypothetical protein
LLPAIGTLAGVATVAIDYNAAIEGEKIETATGSLAAVVGQSVTAWGGFQAGATVGAIITPFVGPWAIPILGGVGAAAGAIGFDVFGVDDMVKNNVTEGLLKLQKDN